jgi:hypothetical protein
MLDLAPALSMRPANSIRPHTQPNAITRIWAALSDAEIRFPRPARSNLRAPDPAAITGTVKGADGSG